MKHLKTYEKLNRQPIVGDYVVVKFLVDQETPRIQKELEKSIGKINRLYPTSYHVKFGTITFNIDKKNIFDFSDKKEDLEYYINAKNYNL